VKRFSDRHGLTTLSELNVTPLLDLAFVLLIIFMITTPLMENKTDLVLPSSEATKNAVDQSKVQTIAIARDEALTFNGRLTTLAQLEADLRSMQVERGEVAVVVRSHKELPVQKLIDVLDAVKRAKISKVGVVTNPEP
jgi:biopolymer transport protein ExbD